MHLKRRLSVIGDTAVTGVRSGVDTEEDLPDPSTALAYLFGLLYAVNFSYPKDLKYTFDTIQNLFMELGSGSTQSVLFLKNKLLQVKQE
ncbi:Zona pellucida-like domain-containing protein 1 [Labeo rohita]|uniref:Zona pellucida-like domain-containing protein 1 n=1 Tax=Labeo rohita TaxID=84645 RepID=A0ABQ8MGP0_LABRO|nr:Zona pellucida-like domain-containing protein 1 [Labeo rohita]